MLHVRRRRFPKRLFNVLCLFDELFLFPPSVFLATMSSDFCLKLHGVVTVTDVPNSVVTSNSGCESCVSLSKS